MLALVIQPLLIWAFEAPALTPAHLVQAASQIVFAIDQPLV